MSKQKEKIKEFSGIKEEELQRILVEKREALRQYRFDLSAGKVKNVRAIKETRKDIARIKTILKQT